MYCILKYFSCRQYLRWLDWQRRKELCGNDCYFNCIIKNLNFIIHAYNYIHNLRSCYIIIVLVRFLQGAITTMRKMVFSHTCLCFRSCFASLLVLLLSLTLVSPASSENHRTTRDIGEFMKASEWSRVT